MTAVSERPESSVYVTTTVPPVLACLNLVDTQLYLNRLGLDPELAYRSPSVELLSRILLAHHVRIPYDSSRIHVPDWSASPSTPIEWRKGPGMQLGRINFETIVGINGKDGKQQLGQNGLPTGGGGYCYALNQSVTALLRGFGFTVSELPARVFLHRGRDPRVSGHWWSHTTHSALLVDWPGAEHRIFMDVGFGGGGSPIVIPFFDGSTAPSLSANESFLIRFEKMPIGDLAIYADPPEGFTLYRRVEEEGFAIADHSNADQSDGYWTPCIHCSIASMSPDDITAGDFYNSFHPKAPWANIFLVSILLPNGARRTLCHGIPAIDQHAPVHPEGKKLAKLYSKEGIKGTEYDVEWIVFETGPIREVLVREFNYRC
ncbi:uncharacterized protein JCM15063_002378 [Sporobolomyces koalae]|uniref:uncharacterized protein n=1 Tax=Sporobolomyces koalae TaxID=500713 RepID=UPI00316DFCA3